MAGGTDAVITVRAVTKEYRKASRRHRLFTLKSALVKGELFRSLAPSEKVSALRDVSFQVARGQTFGIVGANGSGKSTMLKILAGILKPTAGSVDVKGRVASLIELGAGFHPEISGRENVKINAIMLGLTRKEADARFDAIVEFAGLGAFIDDPVKTYSSGMYARLGFAVAVSVDPDVLLVDEILAVGDEAFSRKCLDKFKEFKRKGKTIVIVSHDLDTIDLLCEEVLWLKGGAPMGTGLAREIIDAYRSDVERSEDEELGRKARRNGENLPAEQGNPEAGQAGGPGEARRRWGSGAVEIERLALLDADGAEKRVFHTGDRAMVAIDVRAGEPVTDFVFGFAIFNSEGVCCYGTNTAIEGFRPKRLQGRARVVFAIDRLTLVHGTYYLDVAVHKADGFAYDYRHLWLEFKVRSAEPDIGVFRPDHTWRFEGDIDILSRENAKEGTNGP